MLLCIARQDISVNGTENQQASRKPSAGLYHHDKVLPQASADLYHYDKGLPQASAGLYHYDKGLPQAVGRLVSL
jgi:hypothetical protein